MSRVANPASRESIFAKDLRTVRQCLNGVVNHDQHVARIVQAFTLMFHNTFIEDSNGPCHCMFLREKPLQIEFWSVVIGRRPEGSRGRAGLAHGFTWAGW
jgi:hypothetical protein